MEVGELVIARDLVTHALLGAAHLICDRAGAPITAMSALDWDRPTRIPTIAEPGRLPPGSGALLLNTIAERARAAHIGFLRYAGPYPTPALYRALLRSFRTTATEREFTADVLQRALRLADDELAFDFIPAPHTRVSIQPHSHPGVLTVAHGSRPSMACGFAELRDGLERAVIECPRGLALASARGDTIMFEPLGSPGRLIDGACELWFGDACWARIAELSPRGELIAGPFAPPATTSDIVGRPFPAPLREAIAELVAEAVPAPLAADAQRAVSQRTLVWADLGGRLARRTPSGFELHAALWERIAPLGLARLALALVEALSPVVTTTLVAEVATGR